MEQVINFTKSYQDRLREYIFALKAEDEILPATEVKKQWSTYLELTVTITNWQAFWKIPRYYCERFQITYPTTVLVYVIDINFNKLIAAVEIIAVQDDIRLSANHLVYLKDLWPTKHQDDNIDITYIANSIDMLRFFYNNLWMPSDITDHENTDWVDNHLKRRLNLFYDTKSALVPKNIAMRYYSLLLESKSIQSDMENNDLDEETRPQLIDLKMKMALLKRKMFIMENPLMWSYLIVNEGNRKQITEENDCWIVFKSVGRLDSYDDFLTNLKLFLPYGKKTKTSISLQQALDSACPNDTIILDTSVHSLNSISVFEDGGIIKSLNLDNSATIIKNLNKEIMIELCDGILHLENLSLNAKDSRCLLARAGKIKIKNCNIYGNPLVRQEGIVVLPGAQIILDNCRIAGFKVGVYAHGYSNISFINCIFTDLNIGLKFFDDTIVHLQSCIFDNCNSSIYAITKTDLEQEEIGNDISVLKRIPNVTIDSCNFDLSDKITIFSNKSNEFSKM